MVSCEPEEPLVNMLESLRSIGEFRRDADSFFEPMLQNVKDKVKRADDVNDYLMSLYDRNHDGVLDKGEQYALFKEMKATAADQRNIMKAIDRNRDGKIDKNELKQVWLYSTYTS
ncbi:CAE1288601.1unnamed protein product [Octopus vulgaris]|uniref:CAE1288601.1unnamed protein product n=1 Tax=Octopus vulgaris TaxID=6645 RepID=A0AA36BPC6_OCTVU|nr:CAE1288601.1unnamed protein product [Octopus vulgaris]